MKQTDNEGKRRGKRGSSETTEEPSFEEQLDELDTIVSTLEEGKLPLDEALTLYERGMRLAQSCQRRLDEAELRVSRLRASEGDPQIGETSDRAFILEAIEIDGD